MSSATLSPSTVSTLKAAIQDRKESAAAIRKNAARLAKLQAAADLAKSEQKRIDDEKAADDAKRPLSQQDKEAQAAFIVSCLKAAHLETASAALRECKGIAVQAALLVGTPVLPTLALLARLADKSEGMLNNTLPSTLYRSGNCHGIKTGTMYASRFGLSALYRDMSKADLKAAKLDLIDDAK